MERGSLLLNRLISYSQSDYYPLHMPGHKRNGFVFPDPYSIDITEIDGFDNLHHPEGILKESMEWAAKVYGADRTWYLVNGSSGGILSAILAATTRGGKILMSRNCHKSAYHGVILNHLEAAYIYPQVVEPLGIQGGIRSVDVEKLLEENPDTQAVLIVSPTYEGIVSDIEGIAGVVHKKGIPLIVDEAHGAHFSFGEEEGFPRTALLCGADLVVQSLHKTLPSFTQTAVLHQRGNRVPYKKVERYLQIFQSSSPSYLLMAGAERCIDEMAKRGEETFSDFSERLASLRKSLSGLRRLRLLDRKLCGQYGIYDVDESKVVISVRGCSLDGKVVDGAWLGMILRERYHMEMELCGFDYAVAILTICDTQEGIDRLQDALQEIDAALLRNEEKAHLCVDAGCVLEKPEIRMCLAEALDALSEEIDLVSSVGRISTEFIYLYPPGIPIVVPGEVLTEATVRTVVRYGEIGLPVQGPEDPESLRIRVVR